MLHHDQQKLKILDAWHSKQICMLKLKSKASFGMADHAVECRIGLGMPL